MKATLLRKEENKVCVFIDDIIVYIENPKEFTRS